MKNTNQLIPMIMVCWSLMLSSCEQIPAPNGGISDHDALDAVLDDYVQQGYYPFLYARLEALDGGLLYEYSAVNQSLLPDTEIDENSWIRIWSMSKIVTISLALDLVEDGLLGLNDPVERFIPEFKDLKVAVSADGQSLANVAGGERASYCPVKRIPLDSVMTVLHLINHQAGFYYALTGFPCLDSLAAAQNLPTARNSQELIDRLAQLPLIQQPGTTYFYGTNTTVLGLVAERAAGKPLAQLIRERITGPLGIEGLQYGLPEGVTLPPAMSGKDTLLRRAQPGELDIFGPDVPDYDPAHPLYLGGEGMLATADGYADFLRMLLNKGSLNGHRFLDESTVEDIYAPHTQLDNPYGHNGYNLWVSSDSMRIKGQGDVGLWIGGGYESTHFWVDPKREFVGVIMSQMSFAQPEAYGRDDTFRGAVYKQIWAEEQEESTAINQ